MQIRMEYQFFRKSWQQGRPDSGTPVTGICLHRIRFCKVYRHDTCIINLYTVHGTVQSCKIDIQKHSGHGFPYPQESCLTSRLIRNHLTRFDITDKLGTYRSKCTALRSQYVSIVPFSRQGKTCSHRGHGL